MEIPTANHHPACVAWELLIFGDILGRDVAIADVADVADVADAAVAAAAATAPAVFVVTAGASGLVVAGAFISVENTRFKGKHEAYRKLP